MFGAICLGSSLGIPILLSMVPSQLILCSNTCRRIIINFIFVDNTMAIVFIIKGFDI
jgi:hypothetical protein